MRKVFIALLIFGQVNVYAKTFFIGLQTNHVSAKDKLFAGVRGGDTLLLEAGTRGGIQFSDFMGDHKKPITIINSIGLCEIKETVLPYGISLRNCHYVSIAGNGSMENRYGIKVAEVSHDGAGLGISDRSDNIEVCNLEISNTKGPGILCKTNPDCTTRRESYTAVNFNIHNNYVHHTGTEGMYIGSTAFEGTKVQCDSNSVLLLPPLLKNVDVYENLVEYTGWDGIQISLAVNVKCFRNKIHYDSQKDEPWQNCGLIIGGGASGKFYDNEIAHGRGYPINCFGTGNTEITGNKIVQDSGSTKTAIYINDKLADKNAHYTVSANIIDTKHLPAITIINKKEHKPDLLVANEVLNMQPSEVVSYEGLKPLIK